MVVTLSSKGEVMLRGSRQLSAFSAFWLVADS